MVLKYVSSFALAAVATAHSAKLSSHVSTGLCSGGLCPAESKEALAFVQRHASMLSSLDQAMDSTVQATPSQPKKEVSSTQAGKAEASQAAKKIAVQFIRNPSPQRLPYLHPNATGMVLGHLSVPGEPETQIDIQCYPPSADKYVSSSILATGAWEEELVAYAAHPWTADLHLKGNFLDIGANIGAYTLPLGHLLQGRGEVISVEAMPDIAEHLKAGIVANKLFNVNLFQYAVGAEDAEDLLTMTLDPINKGGSSVEGNKLNSSDFHAGETVSVGMTTLDMMLAALPALSSVLAMKVDIEGNEGRMLKGAHEFFTEHPPCYLHMELVPEWLDTAGTPYEEVMQTLTDFGYMNPQAASENNYHFEQKNMASCLERFA